MSDQIKMKKITPKTFKERHGDFKTKKELPTGFMDFDDNKDLKNSVIGSTFFIKQKVRVTQISEEGVNFEIIEMGTRKDRNPRDVKKTK